MTTPLTDTAPRIIVWDAIMGRGKTNHAISMMNDAQQRQDAACFDPAGEPEERRFIYITPLLDEAERIKNACPALGFAEPESIKGRKLLGFNHLIERGRNIVATHALFQRINGDTLRLLRQRRYTLIIDEALECIAPYPMSPQDFGMLAKQGFISKGEVGRVLWNDASGAYAGRFEDVRRLCQEGSLLMPQDKILMWQLPVEFLRQFETVYVLTYLFEASVMSCYLRANGLGYEVFSINRRDRVVPAEERDDEADKERLRQLIHIIDDPRMNAVGESRRAKRRENPLSSSWFKRHNKEGDPALAEVRRATENFYRHHTRGGGAMWTSLKCVSGALGGKGYKRGFTPVNLRATNEYRHRHNLAYLANVFMMPPMVQFLNNLGAPLDQDRYALSEMLQWIWRSRIRDGQPITIFVPSTRMRSLLLDWLGGEEATGKAAARVAKGAMEPVELEKDQPRLPSLAA